MAQQIINLDELAPADKKIQLGNVVYRLPGDIPAELFVTIQREAQEQEQRAKAGEEVDNIAVLMELRDQVLELFRYGQPEMNALPAALPLSQLPSFISLVYSGDDEKPERPAREGGARPPKAGTRSTRPAARRSRSR